MAPQIQGGVYGGVDSNGRAMNIDPVTGEARAQGGISSELALEAAGTSLARSMGYSEEQVSSRIQGGQLIQSFFAQLNLIKVHMLCTPVRYITRAITQGFPLLLILAYSR